MFAEDLFEFRLMKFFLGLVGGKVKLVNHIGVFQVVLTVEWNEFDEFDELA